jgi:hypothetical protein
MERQPVKSSNLRSIGYDAFTKTLEVEFHAKCAECNGSGGQGDALNYAVSQCKQCAGTGKVGGSVYRHTEITVADYELLMTAESLGKHYNAKFRGVRCTKVQPEEAAAAK